MRTLIYLVMYYITLSSVTKYVCDSSVPSTLSIKHPPENNALEETHNAVVVRTLRWEEAGLSFNIPRNRRARKANEARGLSRYVPLV